MESQNNSAASATPAGTPTAGAQVATATQAGAPAAGVDAQAADTPPASAAPESYTFDLPEGSQLPEEGVAAFSEFAKKQGLSQDAAQDLLSKMAPAMQDRQARLLEQARADWQAQTKADKEIGGDKLNENLAVAKKALEKFGTPELTAMLNETGLGNHPDLVRTFYRIGKAISEDSFVPGSAGDAGNSRDARKLYAASGMNP